MAHSTRLRPARLVIDPVGNSYADLIQTLVNYGYSQTPGPGQTLFVATYDWRMPVSPLDSSGDLVPLTSEGIANDLANQQYSSGVDYLAFWLEQAAESFNEEYPGVPLDSVDVIAHSMGGLVVRAYIQSTAYGGSVPWALATTRLPKINDFVMIGTPNLEQPRLSVRSTTTGKSITFRADPELGQRLIRVCIFDNSLSSVPRTTARCSDLRAGKQ